MDKEIKKGFKQEFLEEFAEYIQYCPMDFYISYKGRPIFIVGIPEGYSIQHSKEDSTILMSGKPDDDYWILYNYKIDGVPLIDLLDECEWLD